MMKPIFVVVWNRRIGKFHNRMIYRSSVQSLEQCRRQDKANSYIFQIFHLVLSQIISLCSLPSFFHLFVDLYSTRHHPTLTFTPTPQIPLSTLFTRKPNKKACMELGSMHFNEL